MGESAGEEVKVGGEKKEKYAHNTIEDYVGGFVCRCEVSLRKSSLTRAGRGQPLGSQTRWAAGQEDTNS